MCQKGSCAEGRVAVPTARLCKARFGTKYLPVLGPSGQGRGGPESPTAGPPSVPPGRPHPRERASPGGPPGDGWAARRDPETNMRVFYGAGLYKTVTWRPGWPLEDWMARKETGMQPLPADRALRYGSANGAHSPLQLGVLERALVTAVREHLQQLDNPAKPVILDASKPVRRSPATATFGGDGSRAPARSKYAGTSLLHCGCEPRGALFAAL